MNRVRPMLRWPGGKSRMLKKLMPMLPPHVCYCEPFAGGLALLLAKDRSQVEVINDLNGELVALYLNVQRHLPEVLRMIEQVVTSRQLFKLHQAQPGVTEMERAVRFLVQNRISFGGSGTSFGVAKTAGGGVGVKRDKVKSLINAVHERLDGVVIENVSFDRCIDLYDGKETLFFLDPPYLNADTDTYKGWSEVDLRKFRKRVEKIKGKWIATLDDSEFNRQLFSDCKLESVVSRSGCVNNRTSDKTFGELIITP